MALLSRWPYAQGWFYATPDAVLHIAKDTPPDIRERLLKDVEAYLPEMQRAYLQEMHFTSRDPYIKAVVIDE